MIRSLDMRNDLAAVPIHFALLDLPAGTQVIVVLAGGRQVEGTVQAAGPNLVLIGQWTVASPHIVAFTRKV